MNEEMNVKTIIENEIAVEPVFDSMRQTQNIVEEPLPFTMSLLDLSSIIGGKLLNPEWEDIEFERFSGFVPTGYSGSVFLCVSEERGLADRNQQIKEARNAIKKGAVAIVSTFPIDDEYETIPTILVDSVYDAALKFAQERGNLYKGISIVGSFGKTIIADFLKLCIGDCDNLKVAKTKASNIQNVLNNILVPDIEDSLYVQEFNGGRKNPIEAKSSFFNSRLCIISAIDSSRKGAYDTIEDKIADYFSIASTMNEDDAVILSGEYNDLRTTDISTSVIMVSDKDESASIFVKNILQNNDGINFSLVDNIDGQGNNDEIQFNLNIAGKYNACNFAAAYAAARLLGISAEDIVNNVYEGTNLIIGPQLINANGITYYVDDLKGTRDGLKETIESFNCLKDSGRRIAVLDATKKVMFTEEEINLIIDEISNLNQVVVYGESWMSICKSLWRKGLTNLLPLEKMTYLLSYLKSIPPEDKVLLKGTPSSGFRYAIDRVNGTGISANTDTFIDNFSKELRGSGFKYMVLNGGNSKFAIAVQYLKKDRAVSIGGVFKGTRITHIGEGLFANSNIIAATTQKTVMSIGKDAFKNCQFLKVVALDGNLLRIEENAFSGCSSLREITAPKTIRYIGPKAFSDCTELQTVILPSEGVEIDASAFDNCPKLTILWDAYPEKTTLDDIRNEE